MPIWVSALIAGLICLWCPAKSHATERDPELSLDFLEFLAEWDAGDSDWLDPQLIENADTEIENPNEHLIGNENKP